MSTEFQSFSVAVNDEGDIVPGYDMLPDTSDLFEAVNDYRLDINRLGANLARQALHMSTKPQNLDPNHRAKAIAGAIDAINYAHQKNGWLNSEKYIGKISKAELLDKIAASQEKARQLGKVACVNCPLFESCEIKNRSLVTHLEDAGSYKRHRTKERLSKYNDTFIPCEILLQNERLTAKAADSYRSN